MKLLTNASWHKQKTAKSINCNGIRLTADRINLTATTPSNVQVVYCRWLNCLISPTKRVKMRHKSIFLLVAKLISLDKRQTKKHNF